MTHKTAMEKIIAERDRQVKVEGWTPEHDDEHADGEMLRAAVIYMHHGTDRAAPVDSIGIPFSWPWSWQWWKPKDRARNLERAGALCLAERERLERAGKPTGHVQQKLELIVVALEAAVCPACDRSF